MLLFYLIFYDLIELIPERFLGDQRASYNQELEFKLRIGEVTNAPTVEDIILESADLRVSQTIFGQGNKLPTVSVSIIYLLFLYFGFTLCLYHYFFVSFSHKSISLNSTNTLIMAGSHFYPLGIL
jgi:hypothetical protein